jgi:thioredoxin-dependent peroxiredoxin
MAKKKKTSKKKSKSVSTIKSASIKKAKVIKKKVTSQKKTASKAATSKKKVVNKKVAEKQVAKKPKVSSKEKQLLAPSIMKFKVGDMVPDFQADATSGSFKLSDYKGKKIVLYFYPKDNTSGCTLEGHDFSNNLDKFKNKNTVVFGISRDSVKSHNGFIQKQSYKHQLISDENENVCQLFGVIKVKSMYGRSYLGVDRSTFLIDEKGMLKAEWRGVKVNGHVDEVLAAL